MFTIIRTKKLKNLRMELYKAYQNDQVRLDHMADLQQRLNEAVRERNRQAEMALGHRRQWREAMRALWFALIHQGGHLEISRKLLEDAGEQPHVNVHVDIVTGNMKLTAVRQP